MNNEKLLEVTMDGHCEFYSETGTEGGYWAFQDKRYTHLPYFQEKCSKCNMVGYEPKNEITSYINSFDFRNDLDEQQKWLDRYEQEVLHMKRENRRLAKEFGLRIDYRKPCIPGTHDWILSYPDGISSYDGLHILKNGDKLTIFDKGTLKASLEGSSLSSSAYKKNSKKILWDGQIDLMEHGLFTEGALGFWIHASQKRIGRDRWASWFMQEYPARLTTQVAESRALKDSKMDSQ